MHVYFKNIALENVRCFGKKQTIDFTGEDGKPSMWNLILGDNGVGKTTVLRSLLANFVFNFNRHYSLGSSVKTPVVGGEYFIRDNSLPAVVTITQEEWKGNKMQIGKPKTEIELNAYSSGINDNEIMEQWWTLPLFAYGAARRIGTSAITNESFLVTSLFSEDVTLINAEEWLAQSEYLSLKDKTQINLFERVKTLLLRLFKGEISDIKIEADVQASKKINVLFQTHYGWVPLHQLSLGYKTMVGWMVDFARGLFDRYPDSANPLAEPAVCLVDEIDLHLHPHFQQNLMRFLSAIFPKTQFIVTAHSPLVVQAAADVNANIILLERKGDEVWVNNDPQVVSSWRVDQILTSDLFGLDTALSPETDEKMERRRALLRKKSRSKQEEAELAGLEADFEIVPPEESALGRRMVENLQRLKSK